MLALGVWLAMSSGTPSAIASHLNAETQRIDTQLKNYRPDPSTAEPDKKLLAEIQPQPISRDPNLLVREFFGVGRYEDMRRQMLEILPIEEIQWKIVNA